MGGINKRAYRREQLASAGAIQCNHDMLQLFFGLYLRLFGDLHVIFFELFTKLFGQMFCVVVNA